MKISGKTFTYALLFTVGLLCGLYYMRTVIASDGAVVVGHHLATLNATDSSPFRYRVLAGFLVNLLSDSQSATQIVLAACFFHAVGFGVMYICLFQWLQNFTDRSLALVGVLIVAVYMQLMLYMWGSSLYNVFEVVFLCIALNLLYRRSAHWEIGFAIVLVLATLNRETAVLLPISFVLAYRERITSGWYWSRAVAFFGLWGLVFVGLRVILGHAPDAITIGEVWALNTDGGWGTEEAILKNAFLVPIWIGAAAGFGNSPRFIRRIAPAVFPYLVLFLIFGVWNEVRLLLPVLVFVLPSFLTEIRERAVANTLPT